ncbi:MAG: HAD family hydrolase [Fimbriimonadaceae bacterium]
MRRPIFLDRDGVLNVDPSPYVSRVEDLEIFPYTIDALVRLDRAGYDIYVVSNQQGVALGITPIEELPKIDEAFQSLLRPHGFEIKKFYYATSHKSENHPWRKPGSGMILAAAEEFGLDPRGAFMVGDKETDLIAGKAAGCRPLLVLTGRRSGGWESYECQPEAVFPTLSEAVDYVIGSSIPSNR